METGVAPMKFAPGAKGIALSFNFLVRAEDSTGAFGANTITCKERPPRYFELDKPRPGPRPMTVSLEASWADAETLRIACGKGFPRPTEAIGEPVPGDAWMPDDPDQEGQGGGRPGDKKGDGAVGMRSSGNLPRHSGSRVKRASPESITTGNCCGARFIGDRAHYTGLWLWIPGPSLRDVPE
jgi:hypothetical protein